MVFQTEHKLYEGDRGEASERKAGREERSKGSEGELKLFGGERRVGHQRGCEEVEAVEKKEGTHLCGARRASS